MGERETEADWSSFHVLVNTCELVSQLPEIFCDKIQEMQGWDVVLVLQKKLCASDVTPHKGRLSIPLRQIQAEFLTNEEIRTLDSKEGITVSLIEPCLQVRQGLQLRKWTNKRNHFSYVLTKEWTPVTHPFERNGLKVDDLIQLWSFRVNGNLCFCLVKVEAPPAAVENMATHE